MTFEGILDANKRGTEGFEAGPGLRMTLPIFNGNQGGIAIAEAQVEQAVRQFSTIRDQIDLDVRAAFTQLRQANEQYRLTEDKILPVLAVAEELSRKNYENGGVPYFLVLQTTGQFVDAQLRRADASANIRRAVAELERSVGGKVEIERSFSEDIEVQPEHEVIELLPLSPSSDRLAPLTPEQPATAGEEENAPAEPEIPARRISKTIERARSVRRIRRS